MKKMLILVLLVSLTVPAQAAVLLQDNFEYTVGRETSDKATPFTAAGWDFVKSMPTDTGARGYLYTTTSVPGYSGSFPGQSSSSVLVAEFVPTEGTQSDTYLGWGNVAGADGQVPPNVWFQFWIYLRNSGVSNYQRLKVIYPCRTSWPCNEATGLDWLFNFWSSFSGCPWQLYGADTGSTFPEMSFYPHLSGDGAVEACGADNGWKLGTNLGQSYQTWGPNEWRLVKIHFDTSGSQGSYEMWVAPIGGSFTKVAEWIGGVTSGFTWVVENNTGHRAFKFFSTTDDYTSFIYVDDFVMAESEADLPTYGNNPSRKLNNVTGVRVTLH